MASLRVVSLLPSATEIVAALGLTHSLVARSHECDYPEAVKALPVATEAKFNPEGSSSEIHQRVTEVLQSALSVYQVKTEVLQQVQPTHILTQAQCEVCAVSLGDVEQAVAELTGCQPQIISLQPTVLAEVWSDMERVAAALGVSADEVLASLQQRVAHCQQLSQQIPEGNRPTVACIEWIDPLMAAGNWVPELVEMAGGRSLFGKVGEHSPWLDWEALHQANPDVIVFMPCGFDLARTQQATEAALHQPGWQDLKAVQRGRVYTVDGNQYFNRPGPRLVDSLEILAEIFHPERFSFGYQQTGWRPTLIATA
jgi:iron complex transport system substrate-binding protein